MMSDASCCPSCSPSQPIICKPVNSMELHPLTLSLLDPTSRAPGSHTLMASSMC